jgi:hypothetical protein
VEEDYYLNNLSTISHQSETLKVTPIAAIVTKNVNIKQDRQDKSLAR